MRRRWRAVSSCRSLFPSSLLALARLVLALLVLAMLGVGCASQDDRAVTFHGDVASILQQRCQDCHRAGQFAPFSLVTYDDARRRARGILDEVRARRMPPWKPEPGFGVFADERRLDDAEIEVLERWFAAGMPEGEGPSLGRAPGAPSDAEGPWQLGEPDLVLPLPEPYPLPLEGDDFIRNFLVPAPGLRGRIVRAIELDPGNRAVVHHANVLADSSGAARELDARDEEPGWAGMVGAVAPGGHFLGWTPGRTARPFAEGTAWEVDSSVDLVVQLHLMPTGEPEAVQPRIGLYFTDERPRFQPTSIHLGSTAIDLAPGERGVLVRDEWRLPFDVEALAIYPHAHYLGESVKVWAELPEDGGRQWLLRIDDWDFFWQDEYRFAQPLALTAGSLLVLEWTYDNTAENPRNPFDPPQRVTWGPSSRDEMADVWIQVLARRPEELPALREEIVRRDLEISLPGFERLARENPQDPEPRARVGQILLTLGRAAEALSVLDEALALSDDDPHLHTNRGLALAQLGRPEEALAAFDAALRLRRDDPQTWGNRGAALIAAGEADRARESFERALELAEEDEPAWLVNLALAQDRTGDPELARTTLERAVALDPFHAPGHVALAGLLVRSGELDAASRHLDEAARLRPGSVDLERNRATLAVAAGDLLRALEHLDRALALAPRDPAALYLRGLTRAQLGELEAARADLERAAEYAPRDGAAHRELGAVSELLGEHASALAAYQRAAELLPKDVEVLLGLGRELLRVGRAREGLEVLREAQRLHPDDPQVTRLLRGVGR
ncbi:MAG TPA: tetratricopeptide repeat protein [Thermoanaerobaculia bacterium]|nr:tetratricopeptide repeat protein [Thermoanaerobaculia bacterium]